MFNIFNANLSQSNSTSPKKQSSTPLQAENPLNQYLDYLQTEHKILSDELELRYREICKIPATRRDQQQPLPPQNHLKIVRNIVNHFTVGENAHISSVLLHLPPEGHPYKEEFLISTLRLSPNRSRTLVKPAQLVSNFNAKFPNANLTEALATDWIEEHNLLNPSTPIYHSL